MNITREIFARWSYERDCVIAHLDLPWDEVAQDYLDEADIYMAFARSRWPCDIFERAGTHAVEHPGCEGNVS